ncbi:hypothetical protein B4U80_02821 [Leptotrombidium deliense]|uniref:Surfeit locus protein 4-like protein n=1 Tax=Leptotrombidium deliense TaxID=299467 RepID=A0A443SDL2_9ACAR|nr:hypothetical protein B4U80_02821 [Leptotrombidium deliense]
MNTNLDRNELLSKAEDIADKVLRSTKTFLPTLGRFCLVSTFIEDGIRMWFQWNEQRDYMNLSWNCGYIIATLFVVFNLFGQLIPSTFVLVRYKVPYACGLLFFIVILQTFAYDIIWDLHFLFRNFSLVGALLLVYAESKEENRSLFAGIPSIGDNRPKSYLQLSGRILVVFMFLTSISLEFNVFAVIEMIIKFGLMALVVIGYKTKLSALVLVLWLTVLNFYFNCYWTIPSNKTMRDFLKYDFYQTLSIIGGLLLVVCHGPGDVSLDEHKKRW